MIKKGLSLFMAGAFVLSCGNKGSQQTGETMDNELTMVVGTYTNGGSKGIYTYRFNQETGEHQSLSETEISNPSYLAITDDNHFVYAVSEHGDGSESVSAFSFDKKKGILLKINNVPAMGADPCYIITDGKHVVTANYSGGSISVFPVAKDGSLLPASQVISYTGSEIDKDRQEKPHLHCVEFTPDGKFLIANDLGTDNIYVFEVNKEANTENGEKFLKAANMPSPKLTPGSGPRHITFSADGERVYLITELSGEVVAFNYDNGRLTEFQTVLADTLGAKGSADIHMSPDGRFLYASNRLQADGLVIFSIDPQSGILTKVGYQLTGTHPRNFIITPNGKFLLVASRDDNRIEVYERNLETGLLIRTEKDIQMSKPVCLKFAL